MLINRVAASEEVKSWIAYKETIILNRLSVNAPIN